MKMTPNESVDLFKKIFKVYGLFYAYLQSTRTYTYTRDGQHVTSMINEEFGIMPLGTLFSWEGRNLTTHNNPQSNFNRDYEDIEYIFRTRNSNLQTHKNSGATAN